MSQQPATDIFISYSHEDRFAAGALAQRLETLGYRPWIDYSSIRGGDNWQQRIHEALDQSRALIVLLTPDSIGSDWVRQEVLMAFEANRRVIPLMIRPCEPPDYLHTIQYIDCREYSDETLDELRMVLDGVVQRQPPPPSAPPTPYPYGPGYMAGHSPWQQPGSTFTTAKSEYQHAAIAVERIIFTHHNAADALVHARQYLAKTGYRPVEVGPIEHYSRGSDLLVYLIVSAKAARAEVRLQAVPGYNEQMTGIRLAYNVEVPSGMKIGKRDREFYNAEMEELESAIVTGRVDHRKSSDIARTTTIAGMATYLFFYFVVYVLVGAMLSMGDGADARSSFTTVMLLVLAAHVALAAWKGR